MTLLEGGGGGEVNSPCIMIQSSFLLVTGYHFKFWFLNMTQLTMVEMENKLYFVDVSSISILSWIGVYNYTFACITQKSHACVF